MAHGPHENDKMHRKFSGLGMYLDVEAASQDTVRDYNPTMSVKDYERPLYCKVCNIDCNSDTMFEAHIQGSKHAKKVKNLGIDAKVPCNTVVTTAKFGFLTARIKAEEKEPMVGLQYVEEYMTETNQAENEPRYQCKLCLVTAEVEPIWMHLIGTKHRKKYLEMVLGMHITDKTELVEVCKEVEQREGRNTDLIKKVIDDEQYPMPPNKKQKTGKESNVSKKKPEGEGMAFSDPESPVEHLLNAIVAGAIKSSSDAELAFDVAHSLILKLAQYKAKISTTPLQTMREWDDVLNKMGKLNKLTPNDEKSTINNQNPPPPSKKRSASPANPAIVKSPQYYTQEKLDSAPPASTSLQHPTTSRPYPAIPQSNSNYHYSPTPPRISSQDMHCIPSGPSHQYHPQQREHQPKAHQRPNESYRPRSQYSNQGFRQRSNAPNHGFQPRPPGSNHGFRQRAEKPLQSLMSLQFQNPPE